MVAINSSSISQKQKISKSKRYENQQALLDWAKLFINTTLEISGWEDWINLLDIIEVILASENIARI